MDLPARVHASSAACMLCARLATWNVMTSTCPAGCLCARRTVLGGDRIYAVLAASCFPFLVRLGYALHTEVLTVCCRDPRGYWSIKCRTDHHHRRYVKRTSEGKCGALGRERCNRPRGPRRDAIRTCLGHPGVVQSWMARSQRYRRSTSGRRRREGQVRPASFHQRTVLRRWERTTPRPHPQKGE